MKLPPSAAELASPHPEDSATEAGHGSAGEGDVDFELMVEADLDACWCLESSGQDVGVWRGSCETGSILRRWDDFESLGQSKISGSADGGLTYLEAAELLGFQEGDGAEKIAAAFRQLSRTCHPDVEGGSEADFNRLVAARQILLQALAESEPKPRGGVRH